VPLLILVFVVVPIAELYVIYKVGDAIGVLWTLGLLIADSLIGSWLLRSQGRAVWQRFTEAMNAGRIPHREVVDGVLVIFGGAFLITPGFITDVIGLFLLLPPTRAIARRSLVRGVGARFIPGVRVPRAAAQDWDVEGTATEHDPPRQDPPRLER
jgi:UPF0716 protein FxsA